MNFTELKQNFEELCKLEGWTEVDPPPDSGALVNRALYWFSWESECLIDSLSIATIAGQSDYDLPGGNWKLITDAVYNSTTALCMTDEAQLRKGNPLWAAAPSGIPSQFYVPNPSTVRLYPKPLTGGQTLLFRGVRAQTALVNETDVPDLPEVYHDAVCNYAAWLHGKKYAQGEAWQRVNAYRAEALAMVKSCRFDSAAQTTPAFRRSKRRIISEKMWLI